MADAISIQELIDARTDAKTLEEAVNGDAVTTVLSRLGETYPTLSNALNQIDSKLDSADTQIKQGITNLFENGGLPATPFATKALMTASALVDGNYAMVTDDTVNNGLYVKTAGAWVKSEYDSLTQAKADATAKSDAAKDEAINTAALDATTKADNALLSANTNINSKVVLDATESDLAQFTDKNGNIYARFDTNGRLLLTGMGGKAVQDATQSGTKYLPTDNADILSVEDADSLIVMRLDKDAGLRLANIDGSVQDNIRRILPKITDIRRDKKWFFTDATQSYLSNVYASGMGHAPLGLSLLPSNYTVPNTIVDDLKLILPTGRLSIDTPYYQDDWVVHPFIFEAVGTIRGYRYILAINPYKFEAHENPVIYGSNDLDNFTMLTGFDQPLDTPPEGGFLSDSAFTYDPTSGELICYWRITRRPDDGKIYTSYWCKRTKDMLNWTDKEQFFEELENGVDGLTSPAILFDPSTDLWHLWNIKQAGIVVHRTSPSLFGGWSEPTQINTGTTTPWHIEVRWVGGKMVMLINKRDPASNYFLGISADGINWTFSSTPMLNVQLPALYKATFLPQFDVDDNFYLEVLYTTNHNDDPELKRRLYRTKTNSITI